MILHTFRNQVSQYLGRHIKKQSLVVSQSIGKSDPPSCPQQLQKDGKILCLWCGLENTLESVLMDCYGNGKLVSTQLCRIPNQS